MIGQMRVVMQVGIIRAGTKREHTLGDAMQASLVWTHQELELT
jgi:hypothetical protein